MQGPRNDRLALVPVGFVIFLLRFQEVSRKASIVRYVFVQSELALFFRLSTLDLFKRLFREETHR